MATLPKPTGGYSAMEITSTFPGTKVVTDTGATQRVNYAGHYYKFQITYPPMERLNYQSVTAFIQAQQGGLTAFDLDLDYYANTLGYYETSDVGDRPPGGRELYVDGNWVVGDDAVNFRSGWTSTYYTYATHGNMVEAGDYIKFSGHDKLYQVTAISNPDASGDGVIYFSPPLQAAVADAETLDLTSLTAKVFLNDNAMTFQGGGCGWSSIALNLMEDV